MELTSSSINSRQIRYKDIAFSFSANPNTGDIGLKKDVEAVRQSVMNLIMTSRGERPFQPNLGGNLREYLFENFDNVLVAVIREHLKDMLAAYEPRIEVLQVDVRDSFQRNAIEVTLEVLILSPDQFTTSIEFTVERIR